MCWSGTSSVASFAVLLIILGTISPHQSRQTNMPLFWKLWQHHPALWPLMFSGSCFDNSRPKSIFPQNGGKHMAWPDWELARHRWKRNIRDGKLLRRIQGCHSYGSQCTTQSSTMKWKQNQNWPKIRISPSEANIKSAPMTNFSEQTVYENPANKSRDAWEGLMPDS